MSTKDAGVIIGKSGKNVSEIREQSGAKVTISEMVPGAYERILTVSGPLDTVAKVMEYATWTCTWRTQGTTCVTIPFLTLLTVMVV